MEKPREQSGCASTRQAPLRLSTSSLKTPAPKQWLSLVSLVLPRENRRSRTDLGTSSSSKNRSTLHWGTVPYSEKRKIYPQSQLLLTKALPERISIGSNTSIDRAVEDLDPYPEWNEAAVIKRQGMLAALARSVWHLPSPSTGGGGG